jgi:hypothetical protein
VLSAEDADQRSTQHPINWRRLRSLVRQLVELARKRPSPVHIHRGRLLGDGLVVAVTIITIATGRQHRAQDAAEDRAEVLLDGLTPVCT